MNKNTRYFFILVNLAMLAACYAHVPETVENMELFLNQKIGTEFPKGDLNYFKTLNENSEFIEMERKRSNGCSWAFLINKKTSVIEKWRFTSERSLCTYYNPSFV